jgi:hypothetical protein
MKTLKEIMTDPNYIISATTDFWFIMNIKDNIFTVVNKKNINIIF